MKNLVKLIFLVCCVCLLDACNDKQEGVKPDSIVDLTVTPIHGGAMITYTIPSDRDILYVMVEYERKGKSHTVISSVYDNYLTIEGFNSTDQVNAALYTVSNDEIKSEPKKFAFTPLESPLSLTYKTIDVYPCFGGIYIEWENLTETELGIRLMVEEDGEWVEKEMYFTSIPVERRAFRPYDNVETKFAFTFEDKWGNVSETIYFTGTPFFEIEVEKPWVDVRYMIPHYENENDQGPLSAMWDNSTAFVWGTTYYRSNSGSSGNSFTIDLKQVVKLSRMTMWPIHLPEYHYISAVYGNVQVLDMEMWGTKTLDPDNVPANSEYWLHPFSAAQNGLTPPWTGSFADLTPEQIQAIPGDSFAKDWVYLGRYQVERLDRVQGHTEMDVRQQGVDGFRFDISVKCDPVRYIRFFPIAVYEGSPPPNNYFGIAEMSFWGDTTVPQE